MAYDFKEQHQYDIIFGSNFFENFDSTIYYDDDILQWVDHKIPL